MSKGLRRYSEVDRSLAESYFLVHVNMSPFHFKSLKVVVTDRCVACEQLEAALGAGGFLDIFQERFVQPEQYGRAGILLGVFVDRSESMEGEAGGGEG